MNDFRVISAGLNLRSTQLVAPGNILAVLPQMSATQAVKTDVWEAIANLDKK